MSAKAGQNNAERWGGSTFMDPVVREKELRGEFGIIEDRPGINNCCICHIKLSNHSISEQRPSGIGKKLQTWRYCLKCYFR